MGCGEANRRSPASPGCSTIRRTARRQVGHTRRVVVRVAVTKSPIATIMDGAGATRFSSRSRLARRAGGGSVGVPALGGVSQVVTSPDGMPG